MKFGAGGHLETGPVLSARLKHCRYWLIRSRCRKWSVPKYTLAKSVKL